MIRMCKKCGATLPPHTGRHRPRVYCAVCRPPRIGGYQPRDNSPEGLQKPIRELLGMPIPASLAAVTHGKLVERGVRTDAIGVQVMMLAEALDAGGHSATGIAALSREFSRMLAIALAPTEAETEAEDDGDGSMWGVG